MSKKIVVGWAEGGPKVPPKGCKKNWIGSSLNHHGYHSGTYYRGVLQPTKLIGDFVGWNGGTRENKSSDRILEEALLLPESEEIFAFAGYTEITQNLKRRR